MTEDELNLPEWKNPVFLVRRNDLQIQINLEATIKHAKYNNQPVYYICTKDTYKDRSLHGNIRQKFLSVSDTKSNTLCGILPLSIGMKLALTINICMHDGMVNRAQGILRKIVYDSTSMIVENTDIGEGKSIIIDRPPKYIVLELLNHTPGTYDSLSLNHISIYPIKQKYKYVHKIENGTNMTREFQRIQLPVTPAFVFTEFKCQGATLEKAIIDFNDSNIKSEPDLKKELERLEECFKRTEQLSKWPTI
ncbi:24356_t:CDS:2 [Cetraspora pellucida]|uniref:24356_t:CDS:1 n=1 Tax=Cetraspora pellucida TaxID=1433469 RepID=A0A9N9AF68_9GLOM|nr:24356_t:CDS:2 [Cetraspora pellucida]